MKRKKKKTHGVKAMDPSKEKSDLLPSILATAPPSAGKRGAVELVEDLTPPPGPHSPLCSPLSPSPWRSERSWESTHHSCQIALLHRLRSLRADFIQKCSGCPTPLPCPS